MAKSDLTAARLRELVNYDPETGVFTWRVHSGQAKPGDVVGVPHTNGYLQAAFDGRNELLHRLAWLYVTGVWPTGQIDHRFGIKTDNRFAELRDGDQSFNLQNRRKPYRNNKSGFLGVYFDKGRYRAQIVLNKVRHRLGYFDSPEAAHGAYLAAKRRMHPACTI